MIDRRISKTMIAQAEILLARSAHWSRGTARTEDGLTVGVVAFSSSRQAKDGRTVTYLTRCDGAACSCPGFQVRQACSHAVATRMESERAREAAARKPLDRYRELFTDDVLGLVSAF